MDGEEEKVDNLKLLCAVIDRKMKDDEYLKKCRRYDGVRYRARGIVALVGTNLILLYICFQCKLRLQTLIISIIVKAWRKACSI